MGNVVVLVGSDPGGCRGGRLVVGRVRQEVVPLGSQESIPLFDIGVLEFNKKEPYYVFECNN